MIKLTNERTCGNNASSGGGNNYISVGSWMWMMFVMAIPIIGLIMILVWAFTGDNESRKNYYRAILAWILVFVLLWVALFVIIGVGGNWAAIQQRIQDLIHKH
jgi:hypothetical protein